MKIEDFPYYIINLNYQLIRTQLILDQIVKNIDTLTITNEDIENINKEALKIIKEKFPSMDVYKKFR